MIQTEADRMRTLLVEAVTTLCRSGLRFEEDLKVEGLLAITVDRSDIFVVNINKSYENPAVTKRADKEGASRSKHAEDAGKDSESSDASDGSSPRRKKGRKKRRSGAAHGGSNGESEAQGDHMTHSDETASKRLRGEQELTEGDSVEPEWSRGESSADSGQLESGCHGDKASGHHGDDPANAIKIEIDSDPEGDEDKEQLNAELFRTGSDSSLAALPLDQSSTSDLFGPMPVSMFSASSLPGTPPMNFPSTSAAPYQDASQAFSSPQQGSSKVLFSRRSYCQYVEHDAVCACCEAWKERRARENIHRKRYSHKGNPAVLETLPPLPELKMKTYRPDLELNHVYKCTCCERLIRRLASLTRSPRPGNKEKDVS